MSEDVDAFLEHYGVMGMHWGIRKEDVSGKKQPSKKGMSWQDKERLMRIGLIAAGTILAVGGAIAISQANATVKANLIRRLQIKHMITWKQDMRLTKDMSLTDLKKYVVDPINPHFGAPGTTNNCLRASMAYEMRRRGFNVMSTVVPGKRAYEQVPLGKVLATVSSSSDLAPNIKTTNFRDVVPHPPTRMAYIDLARKAGAGDDHIGFGAFGASPEFKANAIFQAIAKHPPKSRGELSIYNSLSGHSVSWEIIKGKPVVIDAQSGRMYTSPKQLVGMVRSIHTAGISRLDNKPMNKAFLERWLTDAS